ncbi:PucR family transcriptional regulator [Radiobacillus sp. PE A8.2]|uniref:PucR family transcriptional regulator n=1 Tax=Radiobacillus sp. PE A8.2 TaxID=3380349 RepID=UPI00388F6BC9
MKLIEVLKIPALEGSMVIAGAEGLQKEVLHVNMMDAPDIIDYLKPNELLVTTAYHLKDDPGQLHTLIELMAEHGCAALGIKTQRFLKQIPKSVIDVANARNFPIIELPIHSSLGDIVNQALSHILDKRTNELRFAIDTHKQFSQHIISGSGIEKLLRNLSEMIRYPVVLLDKHVKPIAFSHKDKRYRDIVKGLYRKDSAVFTPETSYFTFSTLPDKETYSVYSVYTYEKTAGYLVVFGEIHAEDHAAMLTIEQATNVISFELMKEIALQQYSRRIRNEFFFNVTEGAFSSQEEIINRAKEFNLAYEQKYLCAIGKLEVNASAGTFTQNQREYDSIFEYLEEELAGVTERCHLFTRGELFVLLFEVEDATQLTSKSVVKQLEQLQIKVTERYKRVISFGISNFTRTFLQVKNAFKEAQDALYAGEMSGRAGFIQSYRTKDVVELLRAVPKDDLTEFYYHVLKQLAGAQRDDEQTLLNTLFVYLESHCQISETAKRLFVHRNTVVYRLEKCEEVLGGPINDPETTLQIRLALRIKTLLKL